MTGDVYIPDTLVRAVQLVCDDETSLQLWLRLINHNSDVDRSQYKACVRSKFGEVIFRCDINYS